MLITTNDYFQNREIEAYLGQVNEQIVIGANIFRDVFASFRDVFGGQTKGYKKELDKLKQAAIYGLEKEAKNLKGNAVIGFNMDIDEISGGGKSMFMVNVYGTAVRFKEDKENDADYLKNGRISAEVIENKVNKKIIQEKIKNGKQPFSNIDVDLLIKYEVFGIFNEKFDYKALYGNSEKLNRYMQIIPEDEIESILLNSITDLRQDIWENLLIALQRRNWFDSSIILNLLRDEDPIKRLRALRLCGIKKNFYEREDAKRYYELAAYLKTDFNSDIIKTVEEGTFKKTVCWKCPNCFRTSKLDIKSCECGAKNRHGLKSYSLDYLKNELSKRAIVLHEIFIKN